MGATMRAIRLSGPVDADDLVPQEVEKPEVRPGWVRIRIRAFGINGSEVISRKGGSDPSFTFPRILGIEGVGEVDAVDKGSVLTVGETVAVLMGGLGRLFDGSYAEYTLVPERQVVPFRTTLPWEVVGAMPEMFQTAYGSLTTGLRLQQGQTLLIRGGTSSVGLTAATLAKDMGATVLATTRREDRLEVLSRAGVDQPLLDRGHVADQVGEIVADPDASVDSGGDSAGGGVDAALELVGPSVLRDTLACVRRGGMACLTGALDGQWNIPEFSPFEWIPTGVHLTTYGGDWQDLPPMVFQRLIEGVQEGRLKVNIAHVYHGLDQVRDAQRGLESGATPGKHVVVLD